MPLDLYSFEQGCSNKELCSLIESWLDKNKQVDGICCTNDHIAAMVLKVLRKKKIEVPNQIVVTGNSNMGQYFGLAPDELTTVDTGFSKTATGHLLDTSIIST